MRVQLPLLFIFVVAPCAISYKVLILAHWPARSHYFLNNALAKGLAEAGNDVTIVSPFTEKNPPKNGSYREVIIKNQFEGFTGNLFDRSKMTTFEKIFSLYYMGNFITNSTLNDPNLEKFLHSNENFDVVIVEQFVNDAMRAIAYHFKAPLILFSTVGPNVWISNLIGTPAPLSYKPDIFLNYNGEMTLFQKLMNVVVNIFHTVMGRYFLRPTQNQLVKEVFPNSPDLDTLDRDIALVLHNSHESIHQPVPSVPNEINIGGFHLSPPKALPKDLQKFLDESKEGVVYFSMGSNLKPSQMDKETKDQLIKAFGKLKQKVLWKWDEDNLEDQPKNVKISKWFPQQDILAHPNVKVFVTHGGILSTIETVYQGVPILALPVFGDQYLNAQRAQDAGFALNLPFIQLTEEKFTDALNKLINEPQYRENAMRRSALMRDRPMKPIDLAVYWVEFVARHGGTPHLMVAGAQQPLYQYLLLDVIGFVVLVAFIVFKILKIACRSICSKNKRQIKQKTN